MPRLIQLYIRQVVIGFGLSAIFVGALLWLDVVGLRHLVTHTSGGTLAVIMLWVFNGIVFAGVQFGIAVMSMGSDDTPRRGPRQPALHPAPIPVPVAKGGGNRSNR